MGSLNGFYYYTNESYEAQIKDIQRNYTITDILPILQYIKIKNV